MQRLTRYIDDNKYMLPCAALSPCEGGYTGAGAERLAAFENIYDNLLSEQAVISKQLAELRDAGKTKTTQFKELMTKKLINTSTLSLFKAYGL